MRKWLIAPIIPIALAICVNLLGYLTTPTVNPKSDETTPTVKTQEVTTDGLFAAINKTRLDNGLPRYKRNPKLDASARLKCRDMQQGKYYEHTNPKTSKRGGTYIEDVGLHHDGASENLNQGVFYTDSDVVDSWMNSKPHRASILDSQFTEIGFSVCIVNEQTTVVQHKINPL